MKIQVIHENGVLRPTRPLRLKRKLVTIEIPDEVILDEVILDEAPGTEQLDVYKKYNLPPEVKAMAEEMQARLAAVAEKVMSMPEDQLPEVTERQLERIEAFKMREDR